jgi:Na+-translocating ferredoxin:NAD+ oxidoreductase RNF subunit RnfB
VVDKKCPALVCKDLISFSIDEKSCTGCEVCKTSCPSEAISGTTKEPHKINSDLCVKCGICFNLCPNNSIFKLGKQDIRRRLNDR